MKKKRKLGGKKKRKPARPAAKKPKLNTPPAGDDTQPVAPPNKESDADSERSKFKITWLDNHRPKQKANILKLSLTEIRNKNHAEFRKRRRDVSEDDVLTEESESSVRNVAVSDINHNEKSAEGLKGKAGALSGESGQAGNARDREADAGENLTRARPEPRAIPSEHYAADLPKSRLRLVSGEEYLVGVDIGSNKVSAVVAENHAGGLKIIGAARQPAYGVRKGEITDMGRVADAVRIAVEQAAAEAGVKTNSVFAAVNGEHVRSINTRAGIGVGNEDREVRRSDLSRALRTAGNVDLPHERVKLHLIPQKYAVDDLAELDNPLGLTGARLECEAHVVTAPRNAVENVKRAVTKAGYWCEGVVMGAYASASAITSPDERRLGCLVLDIGAGTTGLLLFAGGVPRVSAIIPVGGEHISNDIALTFRVALSTAEKMKCRFGVARKRLLTRKEQKTTLEVTGVDGQERREISRGQLAEVIEARVEELLLLARDIIVREGFSPEMEAGIVLTGGGSLLPGLARKAEEILGIRPRLGMPRLDAEEEVIVADPRFSVAAGLVELGLEERKSSRAAGPRGWWRTMRRAFRKLVSNF